VAIASYLQNFARNARPKPPRAPRVVRSVRQPTTRAPRQTVPRVTQVTQQPTTTAGGRVVTPGSLLPPPAAAAAAAAPAPVTFANLAPSQLPIDPAYEAQVAALARQRDDTLLSLAGQRTQNLQEYGFTQAPTGAIAFDPSNPFSRAALLRKNYQESKQGTQTGYAARGQLYAGALQTAQAANDTGFNQNENSLERALIGFLTNNQGAQNRARSAFESSVAQAMADRVMRAQQDLANNPPVVPDAGAAPDTPPAAPGANAPGAPRPAGAGPSFISGYQNIPKFKVVGGKYYRLGASGKWIPV
jgi:hypothetical protein